MRAVPLQFSGPSLTNGGLLHDPFFGGIQPMQMYGDFEGFFWVGTAMIPGILRIPVETLRL